MTLKQKAFLVGVLNPDTWTTVCLDCLPVEKSTNHILAPYIVVNTNWINKTKAKCTICGPSEHICSMKSKQINIKKDIPSIIQN